MQHALTRFGRRCRELRMHAGYTIGDQSNAMNLAPESISCIESGSMRPDAEYINKFATWLGAAESERKSLLCTAAMKSNVVAFPKLKVGKEGLRLFRKISTMSPHDIRDLRRKRSEESDCV